MAGMPFQLNSTDGCGLSRSHISWWVSWKNHCNSPVVASSAKILVAYRFAPARPEAIMLLSGSASVALPVLKYTILRVGSKVGVPQTDAPPCCQLVPAHELGSVVQKRQRSFPVAGAYASKC